MEMTLVRICAPPPAGRAGACSRGGRKVRWPPDGMVAEPRRRRRERRNRRAQLRLVSTGRSRVCAFMNPSHHRTAPAPVRRAQSTPLRSKRAPCRQEPRDGGVSCQQAPADPDRHQRDLAPASSIVESIPEPRAPVAANEHGDTYDYSDSYRRIRLQRAASPCVLEGSRPCASAPACTSAPPTTAASCTCLWEIIDNADEALKATATPSTCACPDYSASVADSGRSIPIDIVPARPDRRR